MLLKNSSILLAYSLSMSVIYGFCILLSVIGLLLFLFQGLWALQDGFLFFLDVVMIQLSIADILFFFSLILQSNSFNFFFWGASIQQIQQFPLSNIQNIQIMLSSVKSGATKLKKSVVRTVSSARSCLRRYKGIMLKVLIVLALIALVVALVLESIKGVDVLTQGVIINHTEQRIIDGQYSNERHLIGLGSFFYRIPKRKFLIYFTDDENLNSEYVKKPITARVQQGTKISVQATVQCKISVANLRNFLQEYGLDWHIYPLQKTKNVIIQNIMKTKFYELNNTLLISQINAQFTSYLSIDNYPFQYELISIRIKYPQQSFSINNTLGINLMEQKSLLNQYQYKYSILNNKIINNINTLQTYAQNIGNLSGKIKKQQQEISTVKTNWLRGLQLCTQAFQNQQYTRKYVWIYFQNIYNSTYKPSL